MSRPPYTLEQLAKDFKLTYRTARYYVETVLPEHHRSGPGKSAQYGEETRNCFKFIKKAKDEKLTLAQIKKVLRSLDQKQIDRVASGEEDLTIVPMATGEHSPSHMMASASRRSLDYIADSTMAYSKAPSIHEDIDEDMEELELDYSEAELAPHWQVLYEDEELQIKHNGQADAQQREQIRLTAELIKNMLRRK